MLLPARQAVSGTATVLVAPGKKVDHLGIKAELIGQIGEWLGKRRGCTEWLGDCHGLSAGLGFFLQGGLNGAGSCEGECV